MYSYMIVLRGFVTGSVHFNIWNEVFVRRYHPIGALCNMTKANISSRSDQIR